MRVFKTKVFMRFVRKERIDDAALCRAIASAEAAPDADLGGGVIKQRVARPNQGKSGGYRTIIFFRRGDRAFFIYGFAKNDLGNITEAQERGFKKLAPSFLDIPWESVARLVSLGEIFEVHCDDKE
jgi:hypothetical protein